MGYTNKTSHYNLPQWIAGDKPSWLGDVNTAMLNIDTAIAGADASASAAESSAAAANAQVQAQEAKITKNTTDIQALTENLADTQGEVNNVKTTAEGALPKSGGTMTGNLILNGAPTSDLQAATKKYVDDNAGAGIVYFMPQTPSGITTNYLGGCAIERAIILSGFITVNTQQSAGAVLGTFEGNPFNLQQSSSARTCGFLTDMTNMIACKATYDGENTSVTVGATLAAGKYILSAGGEF